MLHKQMNKRHKTPQLNVHSKRKLLPWIWYHQNGNRKLFRFFVTLEKEASKLPSYNNWTDYKFFSVQPNKVSTFLVEINNHSYISLQKNVANLSLTKLWMPNLGKVLELPLIRPISLPNPYTTSPTVALNSKEVYRKSYSFCWWGESANEFAVALYPNYASPIYISNTFWFEVYRLLLLYCPWVLLFFIGPQTPLYLTRIFPCSQTRILLLWCTVPIFLNILSRTESTKTISMFPIIRTL